MEFEEDLRLGLEKVDWWMVVSNRTVGSADQVHEVGWEGLDI